MLRGSDHSVRGTTGAVRLRSHVIDLGPAHSMSPTHMAAVWSAQRTRRAAVGQNAQLREHRLRMLRDELV
jgi:hypothetical protein